MLFIKSHNYDDMLLIKRSFIKRSQLDLDSVVHEKVTKVIIRSR